jgi:hypothetical protein
MKLARDGDKLYEVRTEGLTFARIFRLEPIKTQGELGEWMEEMTGSGAYHHVAVAVDDEDELLALVLRLGKGFSRSQAWTNLYGFAQTQTQRQARLKAQEAGQ